MAKERRALTRDLVKGYLDKSETERLEIEAEKKKKKKKKRFAAAVTMVTRTSNTISNTLVDRVKAETAHSDFRTRVRSLMIGLGLAVAVLAFSPISSMVDIGFIAKAESVLYDSKMKLRWHEPDASANIVHLDLDDKTISAVGRWPWRRDRWALFVEAQKELGVRRLVFDVEFYNRAEIEVDELQLNKLRAYTENEIAFRVNNFAEQPVQGLRNFIEDITRQAEMQKRIDAMLAADLSHLTPEERVKHEGELKTLIAARDINIPTLQGQAALLRSALKSRNPVGELVRELDGLIDRTLVNHDRAFSEAVERAGNVYMPLHFANSELLAPGRPVAWNDGLMDKVFALCDGAYARESLDEVTAKTLEAHLVGLAYTDDDGNTGTIDAALAEKIITEELSGLQKLWAYRHINGWYAKQDDALVRRHMLDFMEDTNFEHVSAFRSRPGDVLENFKTSLRAKEGWAPVLFDQLQKFYTKYAMFNGLRMYRDKAGRWQFRDVRPYALPISVLPGHSEKNWDKWAVRKPYSSKWEHTVPHFRDIEIEAAIFELFAPCAGTGFVSIDVDEDGILRRVPMVAVYLDTVKGEYRVIPQLALMTLLDDTGADISTLEIYPGKELRFKADPARVEALRLSDHDQFDAAASAGATSSALEEYSIAIDDRCAIRLNWYAEPGTSYDRMFRHAPIANFIQYAKDKQFIAARAEDRKRARADIDRVLAAEFYVPPEVRDGVDIKGIKAAEYFKMPMSATASLLADAQMFSEDQQKALVAQLMAEFERFGEAGYSAEAAAQRFFDAALATQGLHAGISDDELVKYFFSQTIVQRFRNLKKTAQDDLERPLGRLFHSSALKALDLPPGAPPEAVAKREEQKNRVVALLMKASGSLTDPDADYDGIIAALDNVCVEIFGMAPDKLGDDQARVKKVFLQDTAGRLRNQGRAFRKLMFSGEQKTVSSKNIPRAIAEPDSKLGSEFTDMVAWEIRQMAAASVIPGDSPLLQASEKADAQAMRDFDLKMPGLFKVLRSVREEMVRGFEQAEASRQSMERIRSALTPVVNNRFALVGAAATGLGDLVPTPIHARIPGPLLHTNAYNTALYSMEYFPTHWMSLIVGAIFAAAVCATSARFPATWCLVSYIGLAAAYYIIDGQAIFSASNRMLDTSVNLAAMTAPFVGMQLYRYAVEYRAKNQIKNQFGKILSKQAVEELQKDPDALKRVVEADLCVYFSDIAGFTTISESMAPPRLVAFLNDYMTRMTQPITESDGYVDKFIGDAVMAFWGRPVVVNDYSQRGIKAAIRNCQALTAWNRERSERGEPPVGTRVGLATGPMVVSYMGTEAKKNYTVIGDTVNLASRLEGANKVYGTQIMCSEPCWLQVKDMTVGHQLDVIAVKGKSQGVKVFHVVGLVGEVEPNWIDGCRIFDEGFDLYQQEKWAEAIEKFNQAMVLLPTPYMSKKGPAHLMIERCEQLVNATPEQRMEILELSAPEAKWDGVWHLHEK